MGGVRQEKEAAAPPTALVPAVVVKGKRSKRQRVHAPPLVLTASAAEWSSSAASATAASAEEDSGTSTPSADDAASTNGCVTEEEEDMALCLVLLSRGEPAVAKEKVRKEGGEVAVVKEARFRSRRPADGAGAGEFVYECKTCNKCFPSFQALGGHRTSHKKPRLLPPVPPSSSDDKNSPAAVETTTTTTAPSHPPSPPSAPPAAQETPDATTALLGNLPAVPAAPLPKQEPGATVSATASSSSRHPRVHECSICGAEFASGQALGGHMRRHRPLVPAAARVDEAPRKERSLLELDLNMPAPCDEAETSVTSPRFVFPVDAKRQQAPPPLFPATAASALVGCHY